MLLEGRLVGPRNHALDGVHTGATWQIHVSVNLCGRQPIYNYHYCINLSVKFPLKLNMTDVILSEELHPVSDNSNRFNADHKSR